MLAEVLEPTRAKPARLVGPAQPGHADALALAEPGGSRARPLDSAHDLVADHKRQLGICELAINDVEVGAAHGTGGDPDQDFLRSWLRIGQRHEPQRLLDGFEHHRPHQAIVRSAAG